MPNALFIMILVAIRRWPQSWRRMRSAGWPTISGTIDNGEVSTFRYRTVLLDAELASAQLAYSYQLEGDYYSGYHSETFNDEQEAWSYVDSLKGHEVQVSYNPRKPDISVLRRLPLV